MAIRRILIANRREIAARIIRTCRALGTGFVDRLYARRPDLVDQLEADASHG
jgi:acetyl/propionyl-CoA carboxylase alpha subunit